MDNNVITFSGNNGGSYIYDGLYESYIQAKIDSEDRLAFALKESMVISEADYSNIRALQEAKLGDKIKATWKKFIAFIKGIVAKFMESMTNIVLDEKDYLEKYKDIIYNEEPKFGADYSYDGDYKVATNRLIAVEVPLFEYDKYQKELEQKEPGDLINKIMQGKEGFSYDEGQTPAELFKSYFLALDKGRTSGQVKDLPMKDMYNFCHDFHKMQAMVDKDTDVIVKSTQRIELMIKNELGSEVSDSIIDKDNDKKEDSDDKEEQVSTDESTITSRNGSIIVEKVEIKDNPSSSPITKMNSTNGEDPDAERAAASKANQAAQGKKSSDIEKAAKMWRDVCTALVTAKLTACQQITNDYMTLIRKHVRSYGGSDKKDTSNNASTKDATKYTKAAAKAEVEAKQAENQTK